MTLIEKHKQLIVWYKKKLALTDYGSMWIVFFKGVLVALVSCTRKIDCSLIERDQL